MAELPNPFLKYKIVLKEDYLHNNVLVYSLEPIVQVVVEACQSVPSLPLFVKERICDYMKY